MKFSTISKNKKLLIYLIRKKQFSTFVIIFISLFYIDPYKKIKSKNNPMQYTLR